MVTGRAPSTQSGVTMRTRLAALVVLVFSFSACLEAREGSVGADSRLDTTSPDADPGEVDTAPAPDSAEPEPDTSPDLSADTGPDTGPDTEPPDSTGPELDTTRTFAIVTNAESDTVVPQTSLQLSAEGLPEGAVGYRWSVIQPEGSASVFRPSAFVLTPSFELNVAGTYTFILEVFDGEGRLVGTARYTMVVVPVADLHISLTWHTPNDPDETNTGNEVGSDLDLHVLRTDLGGNWFDTVHDTYWDAPSHHDPFGPPRPTLDRDDTDGAGPENVNLTSLSGATYAVGVHYWDDHDFGSSFVTIRIYLRGQLVEEWSHVELEPRDLWHSHHIDADGVVTRVGDGAPLIQPDFNPPDFFQP